MGSTSNHPKPLAMTHNTLASRQRVFHNKACLASSPESVQIEFLFTLLCCRPLCPSCMPSQTSLQIPNTEKVYSKTLHHPSEDKLCFDPDLASRIYLPMLSASESNISFWAVYLLTETVALRGPRR